MKAPAQPPRRGPRWRGLTRWSLIGSHGTLAVTPMGGDVSRVTRNSRGHAGCGPWLNLGIPVPIYKSSTALHCHTTSGAATARVTPRKAGFEPATIHFVITTTLGRASSEGACAPRVAGLVAWGSWGTRRRAKEPESARPRPAARVHRGLHQSQPAPGRETRGACRSPRSFSDPSVITDPGDH